ncbi:hypothetical protein PG993_003307 [Apiospora rasikravindrae]|uniref:Uncharacterized protein n=1 Tax=Apiospora rasikravindrae TaxID=990691 RepID=A0ABR1TZL4_9PEZI
MPPINHAALSVGVIAASVVIAAGIAIYESPELRRMAEDVRRRIAIALHSLGDSISPQDRENLFNRPEDAEGFLRSRGIDVREGELGVDADDETRRRQREELMYWNAIAEEKREKQQFKEESPSTPKTKTSFDEFLKQDSSGDQGTFVFNTGANVRGEDADGLRRRGDGPQSLNYSAYTNPFADENGIDEHIALENSLVDPEQDENDTDIYSVSHVARDEAQRSATLSAPTEHVPALIDAATPAQEPQASPTVTLERELGQDEYMTAGPEDRDDAYSSIQAWAQTAHPSFYSPLPESPAGPLSEPELVSEGIPTPTDSNSLAGSGEDIAEDARSVDSHGRSRYYDVVSESEGMATPNSWSEVGSVVSENDGPQPIHS